jgi:hypothetical protein
VDVDAIAVQGIWWRQAPHGGDPLFRADPPSDGRWQRGDTVGGLYFADNEQTAWAEWYRALAELAVPPDRQMPRDLWHRLVAVGLEAPRPVQRQWSAFQALGEGLWREGLRGILAPSAARPTCRVLCLFREAHEVTGATPLRPPITYRHGPAPPIGMTT